MKTIEELYEKIGITKEMQDVIKEVDMSNNEYLDLKKQFNDDTEGFYKKVKSKDKYRQLFLYLYLKFAYETYPVYKSKGINDDIYFDTFSDIAIWVLNCKRDYNEIGLEEYDWIKNHLKVELFRLGRLQYQLISASEDTEFNKRVIRAGETILNLHIPQGEPLDLGKCKDSLKIAKEFFNQSFDGFKEITCQTWLLSPHLKDILPSDSNIIQFQSLFEIYDIDMKSREAEERVYGGLEDDIVKYPEQTKLQRSLKNYLLSGKKIGSGFGIIKI